ncbi:MAG: bifunctional 2-C-methyl-D-erythritol 4-phosphate cytidylyltransferase/2-C-methyl-D-erythritol 2,4-cyclodiphosphate synthase [Salinarimonas sp.]|nr:bifunctional 2-C-methyl-D-erythritol 4-phosphate cytidylyltransferase/2-C-methyl-D-erythritol 2,4-cyclodiphosphate synthase [Salinarimonas sp.]
MGEPIREPIAALVVAAGRGTRAGAGMPKQYRTLDGVPVLTRTLRALCAHPRITSIVVAIHPDDAAPYANCVEMLELEERARLLPPVHGGATRQASVHAGLCALDASTCPHVLVHDAARPFVSRELIDRACAALAMHDAALPGIPVTDTIKQIDDDGRVTHTPPRDMLRAVQTPQAFRLAPLLAAHERALESGMTGFTDDGALAEWAGMAVHIFAGDPQNLKLTHEADFQRHEGAEGEQPMISRMATGFDVHIFGSGDHIMLGGVAVPHEQGVVAHSDGDVVLHALTDAVLGALAEGDIGTHFPPSDPQWRHASSDRFLAFAANRVRERGGIIDFLDATILCERPKIGPHREAMRSRIAQIAGIDADCVSIKATTTEKLGFTGRGEGIAAQAAATIRLPAAGNGGMS